MHNISITELQLLHVQESHLSQQKVEENRKIQKRLIMADDSSL